ncbi:hypothetical protein B6N60_02792 [Richelia sinica FACHB-800]|uniref:Uncharacterized protein n=1 Tax=Richelia sinica FACHB-800 TaxID=1357546 RepID=A0A975Y5D1_9NOST|nr:hypothetical protein B6N60_02792 [Richelia sinica FACHB-800]
MISNFYLNSWIYTAKNQMIFFIALVGGGFWSQSFYKN